MPLYRINPLSDERWLPLLAAHPGASTFYQPGWLKTLTDTYGYKPFALTSTPAGKPLEDGVAFCEIDSWITGRRLVSLPFTDHGEPILSADGRLMLADWLRSESRHGGWKYIEMRPLTWQTSPVEDGRESQSFWLHTLKTSGSLDDVFRAFDKDSVQRRIRRAEREKIAVEKGCSQEQVNDFYRLLIGTRKRHHLPPQPRSWFTNLFKNMTGQAELRIARKDGIAIGAIVSLHTGTNVIYKYGCSDEQYHRLAPMPWLFWNLIMDANAAGAESLDFGRTDLDNAGLIRFKDQFGTVRTKLTYYRFANKTVRKPAPSSSGALTGRLFSLVPDRISCKVGEILYRHMG